MNLNWQNFLAAAGARFAGQRLLDFGDAAGERLAGRDATVLVPLTHLAVIEVAGDEAAIFLHNQFTSDIKHLPEDQAQYSAWCSAKGRMLASFLLFRLPSGLQLQLAADLLPTIVRRLQMYILRSQVRVSDRSAECCLLGVSGAQAASALAAAGLPRPDVPLSAAAFAGGVVIRLDAERYEVAVAVAAAPAVWEKLAPVARPVGTAVWEWLDIRAGIPLISERTQEQFVPQMAHFERLGGVSFHKGCYPGQEVVARTQYLGKVKRHLYALQLASAAEAGEAVFSSSSPERACGMIANAAPAPDGGYVALAVLQEGLLSGQLHLGSVDGPLVTRLQPLGD
ncbi:MAG TPA: folate-binding protein [Accumulibacter sp.]|nr:folate-binding protein [Accumulibacter sp.]